MTALRWMLAVPAAGLGYLAAALVAALLLSVLDGLCPPELMVSGHCMAPWHRHAEQAAFGLASALGAALFVALPWWMAPAHKGRVGAAACAVGTAWVTWGLAEVGSSFLVIFLSSVAAGSATAWWLSRRTGQ
ncbi:hypothetical protein [Ottowia sp.]|uniref:hypothetical protein n=1 Tax=Ottowia sp. TaxID=1898956 RepID=UPI0026007DEC|nr:hypothetical protein [Ottowia sp.]MBK6616654.1 hypothetical protein [Ottowia sp.]